MLELPLDANNINIVVMNADSQIIKIPYPILPSKIEYFSDETGELVGIDCYDVNYYKDNIGWGDTLLWEHYLCTRYDSATAQFYMRHIVYDTISYRGSLGLSLTIVPMVYSFMDNELEVMDFAHIRLEFETNSSLEEMMDQHIQDNNLSDYQITHYYNTYFDTATPSSPNNNGKYLIIVPQTIARSPISLNTLYVFEAFKRTLGYMVDIEYYSTALTKNDVLQYIGDHKPDYILLCGSLSDIPSANISDGINSDREYALNDAAIGRWVLDREGVNSIGDFLNIVEKTIISESNYTNTGVAALFSGTDTTYPHMRWEFNRGINYIHGKLQGTSIASSTTDGSDANSNAATMQQILCNMKPSIFVYYGHGDSDSTGIPYNYSASNIDSIGNSGYNIMPMGFGFSCKLNDYTVRKCFGKAWLTSSSGGVTFYGATTTSASAPNFYLSKRIFDTFRDDINNHLAVQMGRLVYDGSKKYYDMCKTGVRRKQYRKYVYFGDPTLSVFGVESSGSTLRPALIPRQTIDFTDEDIVRYNLYNVLGMHLTTLYSGEDVLTFLQSNRDVTLIQVIYSDNSSNLYKYISQ